MCECHKLILLELERSRFCFAAAIRRAELDVGAKLYATSVEPADQPRRGGNLQDLHACALAAGLEAIRSQLRRARQAADVAASSARLALTDRVTVTRAASEASEALIFVAAAVTTPSRQLLVAEAIEAQLVVMQLAHTLAQHHYHQVFAASDAARRALAAGDPAAAAQAAVRAQEASTLAVWAARIGGNPSSSSSRCYCDAAAVAAAAEPGYGQDASLQAAAVAAAARLAEAALAGSPPDSGDLSCFVKTADVGRQPQLEQLQKRPRLEA